MNNKNLFALRLFWITLPFVLATGCNKGPQQDSDRNVDTGVAVSKEAETSSEPDLSRDSEMVSVSSIVQPKVDTSSQLTEQASKLTRVTRADSHFVAKAVEPDWKTPTSDVMSPLHAEFIPVTVRSDFATVQSKPGVVSYSPLQVENETAYAEQINKGNSRFEMFYGNKDGQVSFVYMVGNLGSRKHTAGLVRDAIASFGSHFRATLVPRIFGEMKYEDVGFWWDVGSEKIVLIIPSYCLTNPPATEGKPIGRFRFVRFDESSEIANILIGQTVELEKESVDRIDAVISSIRQGN
jgi:hypothetical protein